MSVDKQKNSKIDKQKDTKVSTKRDKKIKKEDIKCKNIIILIGADEKSRMKLDNVSADPRLKEGDDVIAIPYYKHHRAWSGEVTIVQSGNISKFNKRYSTS